MVSVETDFLDEMTPSVTDEELVDDEQTQYRKALDKAYSYLARREYSRFELINKLKKFAGEAIRQRILEQLISTNAQSDKRFAEMLCRSRFNTGKGPMVVQYELQQHRIDDEICVSAMAPYDDLWQESATKVRQRKFGEQRPSTFKEWVKQAKFLQQRGFTERQIGRYDD